MKYRLHGGKCDCYLIFESPYRYIGGDGLGPVVSNDYGARDVTHECTCVIQQED